MTFRVVGRKTAWRMKMHARDLGLAPVFSSGGAAFPAALSKARHLAMEYEQTDTCAMTLGRRIATSQTKRETG